MSQHLVKVLMVIDAKNARESDGKVFALLQKRLRRYDADSPLLEWVYECNGDTPVSSVKPLKPIRGIVGGDTLALNKLQDEYDRAVAVATLEQTNG